MRKHLPAHCAYCGMYAVRATSVRLVDPEISKTNRAYFEVRIICLECEREDLPIVSGIDLCWLVTRSGLLLENYDKIKALCLPGG